MKGSLSTAVLSNLVGSIYDCALDPAQWPETLTQIHTALDFANASLSLIELPSGRIPLDILVGTEPPWSETMEKYGPDVVDLWGGLDKMLAFRLDEPVVLSRVGGPGWKENRLFREWGRPQGIIDLIALPLQIDRTALGSVGMGRHESEGEIGEFETESARLLLPHVQRAVAISRLLDVKSVVAASFESALDAFAVGVVLVGADLGIVHANAAAAAMLDAGHPIRSERGTLSVRSPDVTAALGAAVRKAAEEEADLGRRGFGIPVSAEGAPSVLHVLPLRHGEIRPGLVPRAVAAVFVAPAISPAPVPVDALAALYDLTAAEARVFELIATGRTKLETAAALGIGRTTVKTHLEHIFLKTGASRQADLIKLAYSVSMPL